MHKYKWLFILLVLSAMLFFANCEENADFKENGSVQEIIGNDYSGDLLVNVKDFVFNSELEAKAKVRLNLLQHYFILTEDNTLICVYGESNSDFSKLPYITKVTREIVVDLNDEDIERIDRILKQFEMPNLKSGRTSGYAIAVDYNDSIYFGRFYYGESGAIAERLYIRFCNICGISDEMPTR